eukprot:SAG31_NODE_244_length_19246_cov_20.233823_20_plen_96_part_00
MESSDLFSSPDMVESSDSSDTESSGPVPTAAQEAPPSDVLARGSRYLRTGLEAAQLRSALGSLLHPRLSSHAAIGQVRAVTFSRLLRQLFEKYGT